MSGQATMSETLHWVWKIVVLMQWSEECQRRDSETAPPLLLQFIVNKLQIRAHLARFVFKETDRHFLIHHRRRLRISIFITFFPFLFLRRAGTIHFQFPARVLPLFRSNPITLPTPSACGPAHATSRRLLNDDLPGPDHGPCGHPYHSHVLILSEFAISSNAFRTREWDSALSFFGRSKQPLHIQISSFHYYRAFGEITYAHVIFGI